MFEDDPLLARASAPPAHEPLSRLKKGVIVVGVLHLLASVAFFSWALRNSIQGDFFDWGIANFAVSFVAAIAAIVAGSSHRRAHTVVAACGQVLSASLQSMIYGQANGFTWALASPRAAPQALQLLGPAAVWTVGSLLLCALLVASTVDDDTKARVAVPDRRTAKIAALVSLIVFAASLGFWIEGVAVSFTLAKGFDWASCAFILPVAASTMAVFSSFDSRARLALASMVMLLLALASVVTLFAWPIVANAQAATPAPLNIVALIELIAWAAGLLINVGVVWADFAKLRPRKHKTQFSEL
jgi:hypothetical protein